MAEGFPHVAPAANSKRPKRGPQLVARAPSALADLSAGAERIQKRKHPVSRNFLRALLRLSDFLAAAFIAWFVLDLSGHSLLHSSVSVVIPFVALPVSVRLGLKASESYSLSYARPVTEHMIRAAIGAGYGLASLCVLTALFYGETQTRWVIGASYLRSRAAARPFASEPLGEGGEPTTRLGEVVPAALDLEQTLAGRYLQLVAHQPVPF